MNYKLKNRFLSLNKFRYSFQYKKFYFFFNLIECIKKIIKYCLIYNRNIA